MTEKSGVNDRQPIKAFMLGAVNGVITEGFCYPFEFVKNVIQMDNKFVGKGMRYTASSIYSQYGIRGFYRGIDAHVIQGSLRISVRFGVYEFFRKHFFIEDTKMNQFLAGALTGAVKSFFPICPCELLKIKQIGDIINNTGKYKNVVSCAKTVVKEQGFLELYKGITPTIIKISSNLGFRFLWYEQFME